MAFQPKLVILTLSSLILIYLLGMVSSNCIDDTKELAKKRHIWIPAVVALVFVMLSFMMTSKFTKSTQKAALIKARRGI
jgi:hypothetical protein